jgi:hypothetical protein
VSFGDADKKRILGPPMSLSENPEAVAKVAQILDPGAFEPESGFGHQEFADEDREARAAARDKARDLLTALDPFLSPDPTESLAR